MIPAQDDIELMLLLFAGSGILILSVSYFFTFVYNEFRNPKE